MRVEVTYRNGFPDGRAPNVIARLRQRVGDVVRSVRIVDVYLVGSVGPSHSLAERRAAQEILADPVCQDVFVDSPAVASLSEPWDIGIEIRYRPGVTDPVGMTAAEALEAAGEANPQDRSTRRTEVHAAVQYLISATNPDGALSAALAASLHNPLVQEAFVISRADWSTGKRFPEGYAGRIPDSPSEVTRFRIASMDDGALRDLSSSRLLALNPAEMDAIRRIFDDESFIALRGKNGLDECITDVELEMIAQTWSEHCKHKIFNAQIEYRGPDGSSRTIRSLFSTYIRSATEKLQGERPFLKSLFHDNSGVIQFDDEHLVCFKVETHNSPSALDPYGGAITGIVGVNRDILGTGKAARPIFNTNVLCFGPTDLPRGVLPDNLLHPRVVLEGVHSGIVDGGNQSGIPVVAGGVVFDESYSGKPLVYCGTGGILPSAIGGEEAWVKHVDAGDFAIMLGGRIGKDGIHGATFSSLALDEASPVSAVQIGDPITQRKMTDFLLEARDAELFKGITDNGAGGLSSSLGEMAELAGGVRIDLDACPLKYPGLAAWEILVSESQERMSLSVGPETLEAFLALARRRDVEATVVGHFTNDGFVRADFHGRCVCMLPLEFLHSGLPTMKLSAVADPNVHGARRTPRRDSAPLNVRDAILALLADATIGSKEDLVRQYDHEVKAYSVVKPFCGVESDGPTDGAVVRPLYKSHRGLSVTHGICPGYGDVDTRDMAMCAVDEAYRSHIILGGDPAQATALDNFCWPDPVASPDNPDGERKLAQLVRACEGLHDACVGFGVPLISGKDSMKNDCVIDGRRLSIRPTLLVSLMGIVPDVRLALRSDFQRAGDLIYLLGMTRSELAGGAYDRMVRTGSVPSGSRAASPFPDPFDWEQRRAAGAVPRVRLEEARALYERTARAVSQRLLVSGHDLSDGGLAVAVCESSLGGRLGAWIDLSRISVGDAESIGDSTEDLLFSESPSRFLVSVEPGNRSRVEDLFADVACFQIGEVSDTNRVEFSLNEAAVAAIELPEIASAWNFAARRRSGG